jgi:O-antigen/teichoic acid export membrane protein
MTNQPAVQGQSRFLSNTAALAVHMVFATLFTFLQVKILASYLPPDRFGLFVSLRGFSLLIATLASAGLPLLLVRFIPELEAKRRGQTALTLYGLSLAGSLGLLLVAWLVVGSYQTRFLNFVDPSDLTGDLLWWFWITTIGWSFKLIVYGGLNGLRRLTVHAALDVAALFAQLVWIFVLRFELTLTVLFKIAGIVSLLEGIIGLVVILGFLLVPSRGEAGGRAGPDQARERRFRYVSYWGWAVGLSVVAIAFSDVDRYFLSQVITLEMLALFHIGARVTRSSSRLLGVPNFAFQPEVTRLEAEGRMEQARLATRVFMKFSGALAVFTAAGLIAFAGEILIFVAKAEYTRAAPLMVLLALAMPLSALTAPLTTVMKALDRVRLALFCDLVWAVLYVGLLFVLCARFGLIGAGLAQLVAGLAQLSLAARLSRPPVKLRFVAGLSARLFGSAALVFAPLLVIEMVAGWGSFGLMTIFKLALLVGAGWGYRKLLLAGKLFSADEKYILMEMLTRRGLGWVAKLVIGQAGV